MHGVICGLEGAGVLRSIILYRSTVHVVYTYIYSETAANVDNAFYVCSLLYAEFLTHHMSQLGLFINNKRIVYNCSELCILRHFYS
jgi:hypothetical protein